MSTYKVHPEPTVTTVWVEYNSRPTTRWDLTAGVWQSGTKQFSSWLNVLADAIRWHDHDPALDGIPAGPWQVAPSEDNSRRALDANGELVVIVNALHQEHEPKIARFVVEAVNARLADLAEQADEPSAPDLTEYRRYRDALQRIKDGHHACEYVRVAELALDGDS